MQLLPLLPVLDENVLFLPFQGSSAPVGCLTGDREVGNVPVKDGVEGKSGKSPNDSAEDKDNGVIPVEPLPIDTVVAVVVEETGRGTGGRGEESGDMDAEAAEMVEGDKTPLEFPVVFLNPA